MAFTNVIEEQINEEKEKNTKIADNWLILVYFTFYIPFILKAAC